MLQQYILNALINGSIIAVLALGFALVYNTTRIFHIVYAALYSLSGYLFYQFFQLQGWPFVVSLISSIIITAFVSLLCELLVYKPLIKRKLGIHPLMVASIGLLIIIENIIVLIWGNSSKIITQSELIQINFMDLNNNRMLYLILYVLFLFTLLFLFRRSGFSRLVKAVRDNTMLTEVLGLNVNKIRLNVFILSGLIVGFVGSLNSFDIGVNPGSGLPFFIYAFIALIIGGVGRLEGPVIGGYIIGVLQTVTGYFINSQWVVLSIFVVLLVFLLYKPGGIIPEKRREL